MHRAVIYIQGFLTNNTNLHYYTINILLKDPTIRFSFKITGKNINSKLFSIFIHTSSKVTVKDINILVDHLSGKDIDNIITKSH